MKLHTYKEYTLKRTGYPKATPWDIYRTSDMKWMALAESIKACKDLIDNNFYEK